MTNGCRDKETTTPAITIARRASELFDQVGEHACVLSLGVCGQPPRALRLQSCEVQILAQILDEYAEDLGT